MKKLPELYTTSFNKKIDTSQDYYKISNEIKPKIDKYELSKRIDTIFKSKNYIYKIKATIFYKDYNEEKTLIGKTKDNLITIDNELIKINDIIDIKKISDN